MPVECTVDKTFVSNNRFYCVNARGRKYWRNGELWFPKEDSTWKGVAQDSAMRTYYGWNFTHSGVIYRKSNENFRLCLRRMTCVREPDRPGYDALLRVNQQRFIAQIGGELQKAFTESFGEVDWMNVEDLVATAMALAEMPHQKKPLRQQTIKELLDSGAIVNATWLHNFTILFKMKLAEIAKPGKYPRLICDLGCGASLQGAVYAEMLKKLISDKTFTYKETCVEFCGTPSPENVGRLFNIMFTSTCRRYLIMFSDDGSMSVYKDGVRRYYNIDIKSCDASHTRMIFELMFTVSKIPPSVLRALRGQIEATIRVESCDGRYKILLACVDYYLQSGITITTVLNCFAQFVLGMAFEMYDACTKDEIERAGVAAGYLLEVVECEIEEDIQFLKMSPTRNTEGEWTASLNLGVILKCSGTCKSDLPGRGPWDRRAAMFQTGLMTGVLSGIDYAPLERLNPGVEGLDKCHLDGLVGLLDLLHGSIGSFKMPYYRADIYRRYRLSDTEIDELESHISQFSYGMRSTCQAAAIIIEKDYGLGLFPSN